MAPAYQKIIQESTADFTGMRLKSSRVKNVLPPSATEALSLYDPLQIIVVLSWP